MRMPASRQPRSVGHPRRRVLSVPIIVAAALVVLAISAGSASGLPPITLGVAQQPTETLKLSAINPAPKVTVTNPGGTGVTGVPVQVSLEVVAGSGSLTVGSTTSAISDSNGVATFANLAVTSPGQYKLLANSGSATVESNIFAVDDLRFGQQPTETQKNAAISPAPTVRIKDPYGVGIPGKTVHVTLLTVSGSGALTGGSTLSETTDANGVATFDNLSVDNSGQYQLIATSDNASVTSNGFIVADQINSCNGGSCTAHGSKPGTDVDASAINAGAGSSLAVSVIENTAPPINVCTGFVPLGAGSFVDILSTGTSRPDITVTWRLDKTLVQAAGNPAASKFDICLGAVNLDDPSGSNTTGWTTKSGVPATAVSNGFLGVTLFWGLLGDCPKKGRPTGPCVLSRFKNSAGDEIVTFFLAAPWDASFHGG